MEKENKNNRGLIILVIVLVLIILCLIGFIVYDKVLNNKSEKKDITTKTSEVSITEKIDENVINETKTNGNNKVNISYTKNLKGTLTLSINDKRIKLEDLLVPGHEMVLYDDYLSLDLDLEDGINKGFENVYLIYDYNGNEIFNKNTIDTSDNRKISDSYIKLENNTLEFISEYQNGSNLFCSDCGAIQIVKSKNLCDENFGDECYTCEDVVKSGEIDYEITYQMIYNGKTFDNLKKINAKKYKDTEFYKNYMELGSCNN